jgi:hypothetical protein
MYSTCLFCSRDLGANQVLEEFPVGRRVAFDPGRGRLWAVCRGCERWNLSPLDERWEAVEAAERIFRGTRLRVSTENIGLARHPEGLELVRVGPALRPEFAAWRYGDQFGRRRRRAILMGVGAAAVVGTLATVGVVTGVITGALAAQSGNFFNVVRNARTRVRFRTAEGEVLKLKATQLDGARLGLADDGTLALRLQLTRRSERVFTGAEARRVAGLVMPHFNYAGGTRSTVQDAVRTLEVAGGPDAFLHSVVTDVPLRLRSLKQGDGADAVLQKLPRPSRLALEMALHEEQERRALEGELRTLEAAWREAEEIAAIADDLLLPESIRNRTIRNGFNGDERE